MGADVIVYLQLSPESAYKRINGRGRSGGNHPDVLFEAFARGSRKLASQGNIRVSYSSTQDLCAEYRIPIGGSDGNVQIAGRKDLVFHASQRQNELLNFVSKQLNLILPVMNELKIWSSMPAKGKMNC